MVLQKPLPSSCYMMTFMTDDLSLSHPSAATHHKEEGSNWESYVQRQAEVGMIPSLYCLNLQPKYHLKLRICKLLSLQ